MNSCSSGLGGVPTGPVRSQEWGPRPSVVSARGHRLCRGSCIHPHHAQERMPCEGHGRGPHAMQPLGVSQCHQRCGTRCLGLGDSDSVTNIHVPEMGTDQESSLCFQRAISTLEAQLHWNLGSLAPPQRVYLSLPSVSPAFRLPPGGGMEDGAQEHKW